MTAVTISLIAAMLSFGLSAVWGIIGFKHDSVGAQMASWGLFLMFLLFMEDAVKYAGN